MAQIQTMSSSSIKVYINGIVMPNIQSLSYSVSNQEEEASKPKVLVNHIMILLSSFD